MSESVKHCDDRKSGRASLANFHQFLDFQSTASDFILSTSFPVNPDGPHTGLSSIRRTLRDFPPLPPGTSTGPPKVLEAESRGRRNDV